MHIHQWKYCPYCGSTNTSHKKNAFTCSDCKRITYENIATTCSIALYTPTGSIVFCERGLEPFRGYYDLPGGYSDLLESGPDAIAREVKEELDFDLDKERLIFLRSAPGDYPTGEDTMTSFIDLSFAYAITEKEFQHMKARDDVAAVRLVPQTEIAKLHLAWNHDSLAVREMILRGMIG